MAQQQLAKEQASLGDLVSDLAAQTGQLIRQEAALAKSELTDKASAAGKAIGLVAAGASLPLCVPESIRGPGAARWYASRSA